MVFVPITKWRSLLTRKLTSVGAAPRRAGTHTPWRKPLMRRGGRVAEGGGLLNRYRALKPYRGFESPSLRQFLPAYLGLEANRINESVLAPQTKGESRL